MSTATVALITPHTARHDAPTMDTGIAMTTTLGSIYDAASHRRDVIARDKRVAEDPMITRHLTNDDDAIKFALDALSNVARAVAVAL